MADKESIRISKFLSLILQHQPERVDLTLDGAGWVGVTELLEALNRDGVSHTLDRPKHVVATNDKRRFEVSQKGQCIGASRGHSVEVELEFEPTTPPENMYYGTPLRSVDSIRRSGLKKGQRHRVHLLPHAETAIKVGHRRGRNVVLRIMLGKMHRQGHPFCLSAKNVWLVDHAPAQPIEVYDTNK